MLYKNPRGVGCILCHKKVNKDTLIATYRQLNKKTKKLEVKSIIAPAINKVPFDIFVNKMRVDNTESKIMPTYFLTNDELKSLYYYIANVSKK